MSTNWSGVHLSEYVERPRPKRPWDVRLWQWLLNEDRLYWLIVLIFAVAVAAVMLVVPQ